MYIISAIIQCSTMLYSKHYHCKSSSFSHFFNKMRKNNLNTIYYLTDIHAYDLSGYLKHLFNKPLYIFKR